jgi:hypothetical protein
MADMVLNSLLSGMREALLIWLVLVALATACLALLAAPAMLAHAATLGSAVLRWRARRRPAGAPRLRRARAKRLRREAERQRREDLARYADELAVAARRAAVAAERRHTEWLAASRFKEAAWRAYDAADGAARRAARASVLPVPSAAVTAADLASRDRLLRRAATEAFRRGELSSDQLSDVLLHRGGWDPRRHPCEHEAKLRLIGQARMLRTYLTASAIERAAWHEAQVAAAGKRALQDEAFAAALRAGRVPAVRGGDPRRRAGDHAIVRGRATTPAPAITVGATTEPIPVGSHRPVLALR